MVSQNRDESLNYAFFKCIDLTIEVLVRIMLNRAMEINELRLRRRCIEADEVVRCFNGDEKVWFILKDFGLFQAVIEVGC